MASGPFTLVQLADAVGMSEQDVRFYRDRSLLPPPRRRRGRSGDVAYHQEHVDRLLFISRALAYGFSFNDIAGLVGQNLLTCADVYRLAGKRVEKLKRLMGPDAPIAPLEHIMKKCSGVGSRSDCHILAVLSAERT